MTEEFEIVKETVEIPFIGNDGNLQTHTEEERFFLENENREIISHKYYCIIFLGDDHFAVCDIRNDIRLFTTCNEYDIITGNYEITPKIKWGVIRVIRDKEGKIIPKAEVEVIPYIYDRISENNLKTATAMNDGKFTYLDLDINRLSYGKQLVPCVLNHAVPFSTHYKGFAECSIDNVVGYLPRNCMTTTIIKSYELLTATQASSLSKYFANPEDTLLDDETISAYWDLTCIELSNRKGHQLTKTRK